MITVLTIALGSMAVAISSDQPAGALSSSDAATPQFCANNGGTNLASYHGVYACLTNPSGVNTDNPISPGVYEPNGYTVFDQFQGFQCTELANRYLWVTTNGQQDVFGEDLVGGNYVATVASTFPGHSTGLHVNGSDTNLPVIGDIISMWNPNQTSNPDLSQNGADPANESHVGIVIAVSSSQITYLSENDQGWGNAHHGKSTISVSGSTWKLDNNEYNYTSFQWLDPKVAPPAPPTVTNFSATPSTLTAAGGQVTLSANVANATSCTFASNKAVTGLLTGVACGNGNGNGNVSDVVTVPANTGKRPANYAFQLVVTGAKRQPPKVTVGVAGSPSSFGSWSIAPSPPAQQEYDVDNLDFISCPTTSFCMAGWEDGVNTPAATIATWDPKTRGSWVLANLPASVVDPQLASISCVSSSMCFAFGSSDDPLEPGHQQALAAEWDGTSWETMNESPQFLVNVNDSQDSTEITAASCTSASFCLAVGEYNNGSRWLAIAETWNGSSWATVIPPVEGAINDSVSGVSDLSCASSTMCAMNDAEIWTGILFKQFSDPSVDGISSVDCVSTSYCLAAGTSSALWNGTAWIGEGSLPVYGYSISCSSKSACVAPNTSIPANGGLTAGYSTWNGTSWQTGSAAIPIPAGNDTVYLGSISCPTAKECVAAGDSNVIGGTTTPMVETYTP